MEALQPLKNVMSGLEPGQAPSSMVDFMKILQGAHNQMVENREIATDQYDEMSHQQQGDWNAWQNIANYGPLMQLLLMTSGEKYGQRRLSRTH